VTCAKQVVERLRATYCGTLAVEMDHLFTREQQEWVIRRLEGKRPPSTAQRRRILRKLVHSDAFERFLAEKFPSSKARALRGGLFSDPGGLSVCV
jgi:2-oxoglutarate dehydrogenase E1 component